MPNRCCNNIKLIEQMRKIHFENIGGNWKVLGFMILALVCIILGGFEMIDFTNPKFNKYISSIGFLILTIYFSKTFWYKNYVQWNKKGIVIRIKSFLGKTLKFDEIKETELNENRLTITKTDGNKVQIDLTEIEKSDTQKLNEIILKNTIASRVDG